MTAKRSALPRAVDHEHRNPTLQRAVRLHEPHLVLDRVEPTHRDEARLALTAVGRAHEIGEETLALVRDLEHLAGRPQMSQNAVARALHLREGCESPRVVGAEEELRLDRKS